MLREWLPTNTEISYGSIVSGVGSTITYITGWNALVELLVFAMIFDYLTGIAAAYINPDKKLDSKKSTKGTIKKFVIITIISFAHFLDKGLGQDLFHTVITWFFIGSEGLSIIENASLCGVPIPKKLAASLKQLMDEKEGTR